MAVVSKACGMVGRVSRGMIVHRSFRHFSLANYFTYLIERSSRRDAVGRKARAKDVVAGVALRSKKGLYHR